MYETLQRPLDVSQIPVLPSVKEAAEKLKQSEQRREEKRLRQIAANKARLAGQSGIKRKRDGDDHNDDMEAPGFGTGADGESSSFSGAPGDDGIGANKKLKTEDISGEDETAMSDHVDNDASSALDSSHHVPPAKISISKAFPEVRGHTSYLTFASLLPSLLAPRLLHASVSPPSVEGGQGSS